MTIDYKTRILCKEENTGSSPGDFGHGRGWHYHYETQTTINAGITCTVHESSDVSDFTILMEYEE